MTKPLIQIHDAETGEDITRELNDAEYAEWLSAEQDRDAAQASDVRNERNKKLKDSDWTQVADAPVDKAAWAVYRQALRDITSQPGFPWTIDWPEQP